MAIRLAHRLEFFDRPVGYKGHLAPTPYLGGAAVIAGFAVVLALGSADWDRTAPLLGGVAVMWALGTVDDRRTLTPAMRVLAEIALAAGLFALDLGWSLGRGAALDLLVTAFWIVAVTNAFNFFDNMDGAASSMAAVVAAGVAALGLALGDAWLTVASAALCGACVGFLPHNLLSTPARIFLGDGGSMPIGFAVGALVMIGTSDAAPEWQSLAIGVLLVGVPALDTMLVIVSRTRQRIPILTGGRDHMTHRTLQRVRTARAVALALGGAQALVSALALVAIGAGTTAVVAAVALYVSGACVAIVLFDTRLRTAAPVPPEIAGAGPLRERDRGVRRARALMLVALGAGIGVSPFFFAYYSDRQWAPAGLLLLACTSAIAVARPVRVSGPQALALLGLGGVAALSVLSAAWSPSAGRAIVDGNRFVALAVLLALLVLLVRSRANAWVLLSGVTAAGGAVAVSVLVRLLQADESLVLGGRLSAPLGYVNGEAAFFLLLLWPSLAAGEQRRSRALAAAGTFAAISLAGLVVLAQSRGATLGAIAAAVCVFALVPGRLRRLGLALIVLACLAPALPTLIDVLPAARDGRLDSALPSAGLAIAIAASVGAAVTAVVFGLPAPPPLGRRLVAGALVVVAVAGAGVAIGARDRVAGYVERQADSFRSPGSGEVPETGRTRLSSGAGNRYDYWRIAWRVWRAAPVRGIGAGGYEVPYYRQRATTEDIRQPHSLVLQTLSELGVLGVLALLAFLSGVVWGGARVLRAARSSADARLIALAGFGTLTAWLVQASVDWLHLLPGVTAVALAAAAVLLVPLSPPPRTAPQGGVRPLPAVLVAIALIVAGVGLSRQVLTDEFLHRGRTALAADPARALRQADRALRIAPETIAGYRLKAAALARFDQPVAARAVLREALRREPQNWVTWALLGDLETRAGDPRAAAEAYGRAARLNPRDVGLRRLRDRAGG